MATRVALVACAATLLMALAPAPGRAAGEPSKQPSGETSGKLAVLNLRPGGTSHELAARAAAALGKHVGGWARQPGIAALLAGRPNPGALPTGRTGEDLLRLVEEVRQGRQPPPVQLAQLGKLLGVDYLLLLHVRGSGFSARLFSVHRSTYAPQELRGNVKQTGLLRGYVEAQTRPPEGDKPAKQGLLAGKSWWVWAIAAGLAAVTIGLAVAASDENAGDLRIRVSR